MFLALLTLALVACGEQGSSSADSARSQASAREAKAGVGIDRSHAGKTAPETIFEDPDGQPATLADFRGKPLLLNLWATWCAPCIAELPTLDALAVREGDRLQVVTLSEDLEGREKVEAFLAARKVKALEPWLDPQMEMTSALGASNLPTTILFDAQGKEVWRFNGENDWAGKDAAALIAEARR